MNTWQWYVHYSAQHTPWRRFWRRSIFYSLYDRRNCSSTGTWRYWLKKSKVSKIGRSKLRCVIFLSERQTWFYKSTTSVSYSLALGIGNYAHIKWFVVVVCFVLTAAHISLWRPAFFSLSSFKEVSQKSTENSVCTQCGVTVVFQ